ncbi:MAG: GNAT family N-acetyltransferase [Lachnospiraceae bacterium]|nr:GNAT family N-acetyltransferase [Lachnospiraceae bacterium]
MDLVVIIGSGAVGKMTVGQELMKITDFRLFHNHMAIEPVIEIFGYYYGAAVAKIRDAVFDEFINSDNVGMIFTYMWAFDMQEDWDYIKHVTDKFEATGGTVYYVELVADRAVRLERNKTENRLKNKASKCDLEISEQRMLREESKYRIVSNDGEIPFINYIKIDNTNLEPAEVARRIKDFFKLPDKTITDIYRMVKLDPIKPHEVEILHEMQVRSFMPLYEKYHDEGSPAIETVDRIRARSEAENRQYYFITYSGARVGAINIAKRPTEEKEDIFWISPIFVDPKYQNKGIAQAAIHKAFKLHPEAKEWRLDTILQEPGNCHLYEKCGFKRIGEEKVINDVMTLVDYVKEM